MKSLVKPPVKPPVKPSIQLRKKLIEAGALDDDRIDLAETVLVLAATARHGVTIAPYRRHLEALAKDVANFLHGTGEDPDVAVRVGVLARIIHHRYGYTGTEEDFDGPDGANLMRVIARRSGLPVTLGILYIVTARAQGWRADGLDFPGRFLVRLEHAGERLIIDPFAGGQVLSVEDLRAMLKLFEGTHAELAPRHYRTLSARQILIRLHNNISGRLFRQDRLEEALKAVETMLLIAPEAADLWRECGLLHRRLGNLPEAIAALEQYLGLEPHNNMRYGASVLLQDLRQRLH